MPYRAFRRKLTASFFAPFIIALVVLASVVLWGIRNQASITGWIEHSDRVMLRTKDAELELRNMQVAYRGYLALPDKRYLTELGEARNRFTKNLGELAASVGDNPEQERILVKITELKEAWIEAIERLIAQKDRGQISAEAFAQIHTQAQAVFNSLEDFLATERLLRAQRAAQQRSAYQLLFAPGPPSLYPGDGCPQLLGLASDSTGDRTVSSGVG